MKAKRRLLRYHFSVPLAGLVAALMMGLFVSVGLGWNRYRRFVQNRNEPFVSHVLYSPITNTNARL
jgi:hypothetical protein